MRERDKMSEKKVIVSNVAKEYSNPSLSWYRLLVSLTVIFVWRVEMLRLMQRALWELWHSIHAKECLLIL